jgi:hypothetical protein
VFAHSHFIENPRINLEATDPLNFNGGSIIESMKVSCLGMIQTHAHIMFSIRTPVVLKPRVTRCLMRLIAPKWSNTILML